LARSRGLLIWDDIEKLPLEYLSRNVSSGVSSSTTALPELVVANGLDSMAGPVIGRDEERSQPLVRDIHRTELQGCGNPGWYFNRRLLRHGLVQWKKSTSIAHQHLRTISTKGILGLDEEYV
jgi:hypothetical protein